MVINYKQTQKTILRVNPRIPLAEHLPAICEKCEFDIETTVLWRDVQSLAPLDLSNSLNDYAIREVYARDTKGKYWDVICCIWHDVAHLLCAQSIACWLCRTTVFPSVSSLTYAWRYFTFHFVNHIVDINTTNVLLQPIFFSGAVMPGKDKNQKEKENKGLFSKFRKSKKKSDQVIEIKQLHSCATERL